MCLRNRCDELSVEFGNLGEKHAQAHARTMAATRRGRMRIFRIFKVFFKRLN